MELRFHGSRYRSDSDLPWHIHLLYNSHQLFSKIILGAFKKRVSKSENGHDEEILAAHEDSIRFVPVVLILSSQAKQFKSVETTPNPNSMKPNFHD